MNYAPGFIQYEEDSMMGKPRLGWVGTGKMGAPMCRRVLAGGYELAVVEPVEANRAPLVAEGAQAVDLARLADREIVFTTLPDDRALRAVMLAPGTGLAFALGSGQTVVEMSTVSPAASAEVGAALAERGVAYLRAPVSGSTATAASGTLTVLASGPRAAFEACGPVLACFASRTFHVGEGDESRYLKLAINAMVGATSALIAEALAFARKGELGTAGMMDVVLESVVASPLLGYKRDMIVAGDYAPAFALSQMMKDLDLVLDAARQGHVPMPVTALIRQQYEAAAAQGLGARDFFALVEHQARQSGLS